MSHFIEADWLNRIQGGAFYYPASGDDLEEPINVFAGHVSEMTFCDIAYNNLGALPPGMPVPPDCIEYIGPLRAAVSRSDGKRHVESGKRIDTYRSNRRKSLKIIWRRGFGQMGLEEFGNNSISVFMHRGDRIGEGGSNAFFLANRRKRHAPLSNLFSKLRLRLRECSLIVSDGSNSDIRLTRRYNGISATPLSPEQVYSEIRKEKFHSHELTWQCVGWLSKRYGHTLVWGVTKN
jgi:hypothetical protein